MLVDEDERLYDAFQALDEDGDGLISKEELKTAMVDNEKKSRGKGAHHRRESTSFLLDSLRVQSAFGTHTASVCFDSDCVSHHAMNHDL